MVFPIKNFRSLKNLCIIWRVLLATNMISHQTATCIIWLLFAIFIVYKQKKNSSQEDELVVQTLQSKFCDRMDRIICRFLCLSPLVKIYRKSMRKIRKKCSLKITHWAKAAIWVKNQLLYCQILYMKIRKHGPLIFKSFLKIFWTLNFPAQKSTFISSWLGKWQSYF